LIKRIEERFGNIDKEKIEEIIDEGSQKKRFYLNK